MKSENGVMVTLPNRNVIPLTEQLIVNNMGYCCLWAFFSLYRRTALIALRLGITTRTVSSYKARFKAGEFQCKGDCARCMKRAVKAAKEL